MNNLFSLSSIYLIISILFLSLVGYFWFYYIRKIINNYLVMLCEIIDCKLIKKPRLLPLYSKNELTGTYKDRQVIAGVQYIGIGFEWMPLPYLMIKLKDVIRYNYSKLPDFTFIKKDWLVFRIKERLVWGIFDRNYSRFFSKDYIVIALARLLAVAEDVERGRTLEEIFR